MKKNNEIFTKNDCVFDTVDTADSSGATLRKQARVEQFPCRVTQHGAFHRVQQLLEHLEFIDTEKVNLHFIGSLQTNKVKYIIDKVAMIHSLDSLSLAQEIEKQAAKRDRTVDVLCEINCGREESKSGLMPEEAEDFCLSLSDFPHLRLRGFMTMAPKCEKNEEYQKYFQETSQLCLDIWQKKLHNIGRPVLSMGMSGSFEAAISEGADVVRIGRSLFTP